MGAAQKTEGVRHQLGQFYTPPQIARLITKWAVRSSKDVVLDAGCGLGIFLIESYKRLLNLKFNKDYEKGQYPNCAEHQEILRQLYGLDIDPASTQTCATNLKQMAPSCSTSELNIQTTDFFAVRKNALAGWTIGGFDAVIGNPPYTRWIEIPNGTKKLITTQLISELRRYNLMADVRRGKEPGLYIYWVMHATKNLLKERGRIGMIMSSTWLQTEYGVSFGQFLLDNFRVVALIDLPFKLFDATIKTAIVFAEREQDSKARNNNIVTLIEIPHSITNGALNDVLSRIEEAITNDGAIDVKLLAKYQAEFGIHLVQIRQGDIPRDRKWISLFFGEANDVAKKLEALADEGKLMLRAGEWFEASKSNTISSLWTILSGVSLSLGATEFFHFRRSKIEQWEQKVKGFSNQIWECLAPAITKSRFVGTFVFKREDWEQLEREDKNAYIFMCHKPRNELPAEIKEYIKWGESDGCRTKIRDTRGGGVRCNEAMACKIRERERAKGIFYGWYDVGGYMPTPLMAIRQVSYHPQYFLAEMPLATYDAIIAFIPKITIKMHDGTVIRYEQIFNKKGKPDIVLNETELKALLAYMNSSLNWLWLETVGRLISNGLLGIEVRHAMAMPILNVKALSKEDVEDLARLFDKLESEARKHLSDGKLAMFKALRGVFREIDTKVTNILNLDVDVDALWEMAWDMMERRSKWGAHET